MIGLLSRSPYGAVIHAEKLKTSNKNKAQKNTLYDLLNITLLIEVQESSLINVW